MAKRENGWTATLASVPFLRASGTERCLLGLPVLQRSISALAISGLWQPCPFSQPPKQRDLPTIDSLSPSLHNPHLFGTPLLGFVPCNLFWRLLGWGGGSPSVIIVIFKNKSFCFSFNRNGASRTRSNRITNQDLITGTCNNTLLSAAEKH